MEKAKNRLDDFCIFILTHGRANNVITWNTLRKMGYKWKIYLVCDDEDKQLEEYIKIFGEDKVKIFSKDVIEAKTDTMCNFGNRKCILYARNACFDIAEELGITYFMEFDDDYTSFTYRIPIGESLRGWNIKDLEKIITEMLDFYENTPFQSIAMGQGGDYIGGAESWLIKSPLNKRKCMNSFLCSTKRPFKFKGNINEDVNCYTSDGMKGTLFLTIPYVQLNQLTTQSNKGGMTDIYLDSGTYIKSFYSIICAPSGVKIWEFGQKHRRIHHHVNRSKTVPMIIDQKYKKGKGRFMRKVEEQEGRFIW